MNANQLLVDEDRKVKAVVKTIVQWVNEDGADSHCLARIFLRDGAVTVIISELRYYSDDLPHPYISSETVAIAEKLYSEFPNEMALAPDKITWILHYGQFSSFEWGVSEAIYEEFLTLNNGEIKEVEMPTSNKLTKEDIDNKLGHLDITDVFDDLNEIGWTKHIGGVIYSEEVLQILAAREAETGSQYL